MLKKKEKPMTCIECMNEIQRKNLQETGHFILFDIAHDVQRVIEKNQKYYEEIVNNSESRGKVIRDVPDGKKYQEFVNNLDEEDRKSYATAIFNTDGSPIFNSSKMSMWLFQIIINETPIEERLNNAIVCGLWIGKSKPDLKIYLKYVVNYFKEISKNGIPCNILGENRNIKLHLLCCCVDSAARPPMQGIKQFNGYFGCSWCLHPGEYIEENGCIKYTIRDDFYENRNQLQALDNMEELLGSDAECVNGFMFISILNELLTFDIIDGFSVDYLHAVLLGVNRQFARYWFVQKGKPYSMTEGQVQKIDTAVTAIKTHNQVGRLTRPVSERKFWNARDWENWMLYYSIPVLSQFLPQIYVEHWLGLVEALYILLQTEITYEDLNKSEKLLREFVFDTQNLYGIQAMTSNVHLLLHLPRSVDNWGPLWCHNCFTFENGNGEMLKTIHAANGVVHQVHRYLNYQRNVKCMQNCEEYNNCSLFVKDYLENLKCKKKRKTTYKTDLCRYFGKAFLADDNLILHRHLSLDSYVYYRIVLNKCLYATSDKVNLRSNNSYAMLKNKQIIRCKEFVCDRSTLTQLTIAQEVYTADAYNTHLGMKKISHFSRDFFIYDTSEIWKPCIEVTIDNLNYISAVPNCLHF